MQNLGLYLLSAHNWTAVEVILWISENDRPDRRGDIVTRPPVGGEPAEHLDPRRPPRHGSHGLNSVRNPKRTVSATF